MVVSVSEPAKDNAAVGRDGFDGLMDALADSKCDVDDCLSPAERETSTDRGYCLHHYRVWKGEVHPIGGDEVPR